MRRGAVLYWDASAVLSALFEDGNSAVARKRTAEAGTAHLVSSLAWTETLAVVARVGRETRQHGLAEAARQRLGRGPWRYVRRVPERELVRELSERWSLRRADLWHLALAKSLSGAVPELELLAFDRRLVEAARGEGLA